MNILYASNICSNKEFKKIYDMCNEIKPLQSIQKFNKLLCEGLVEIDNVYLDILTSAPINHKMCKKIFWKGKSEKEEGVQYNYCFMINLPIIKFISLFFSSFVQTIKWMIKNKKNKKVIIYDAFCPIIANVAALVGKMFGAQVIGMYTDVPMCMSDNLEKTSSVKSKLKSIYNKIEKKSNESAKGYILLTEQMNEVVNPQSKPYIVVEGVADSKLIDNIELKDKYSEFTLLYAGGLYKKFGIKYLVDAVKQIDDVKLILYGYGEMEEELKYISREYKNIEYRGSAPNNEVVKEEKKSTVLINPRFSNETYTKYSFPSKNMEYMASGTPILTTKLSGMPKEYDEYVFFIEEETVEGLKFVINKLKSIKREELYHKGILAKDFVLKSKNNQVQAKKIVDFIKNLS